LWTPGYWAFGNGGYVFNAGYWGPTVGFYGGVNYGFGFTGIGYEGGFWRGGVFSYNRAVNNFGGVHITNVYNKTVVNVRPGGPAFNGGPGGIDRRATPAELAASKERHVEPTSAQLEQRQAASKNRELLASANHGHPAIAATSRPGDFSHAAAAPHPVTEARPAAEPHAVAEHAAPAPRPGSEARPASEPHAVAEHATAPRAVGHEPAPMPHAVAEHAPSPHPVAHRAEPMPHAVASHTPAPRPEEHAAPAPHVASHVATPHPATETHPPVHAERAPAPMHTASVTPRPAPMAPHPAAAPHPVAAPHPAAPPAKDEKPHE
jgi:hypothetical protein